MFRLKKWKRGHGADGNGERSNHGLYSLNKSIGLKNPHITDFCDNYGRVGAANKER